MKRAISSFAALTAVLVLAVSAQASGAGAVSVTQTFHNATQPLVDSPNPCTGVLGDGALTYNGVIHLTVLTSGVGAGTGWFTFTAAGDLNIVQDNGVTFTGHFVMWDGGNGNLNNSTGTSTFNIHATGSDGSTVDYHAAFHITVLLTSPTPTVVVQFMTVRATCT
jgi:hypothetical protein